MKRPAHTWRCIVIPLLAALIVSAIPLPCAAGDTAQPAAKPSLRASIDTAATAMAAAKPAPGREAARQVGGEAKTPAKSVLKSPIGIAALAIVAAGVGYAFYSAHHDRVPVTGR